MSTSPDTGESWPSQALHQRCLCETQNAFLDAAEAVGLPVNDDFNDATAAIALVAHSATRHGRTTKAIARTEAA